MDWSAIGAIGEIVGALAVVISLIYLASQIRANNKAMRSQNIHTETEQMQRGWALQTSPKMAPIQRKVFRDNEKPTYEESVLLEAVLLSGLAHFSDQYKHEMEGLSPSSAWRLGRRRMSALFLSDWPRSWWREAGRNMFDDDFVREVDDLISRLPAHTDPLGRSLDQLRTDN